ncbi:glycosyltransferase [Salipiger marinus]|uniref:Glycosyltransferase involved in cell wall bisynthesis n=1 Tax=Salipiger marinus TaxID=555512 RepID=A0A1G8QKT5_9RHOB|nr:glycosyltransferase [Salipiger marinus]SDJ05327.1 Glycosyltransferase involved in cell wall bisynthesis [Salipiger marinus]
MTGSSLSYTPPRIAVVYTHFPHYRAPVFEAMSQSAAYDYTFHYDPKGIEKTIASGAAAGNHHFLAVRSWRGLMWQGGALALARDPKVDGFIFLGNPFILSTWAAVTLARMRGKPVFLWTHGWLRRDRGAKARLRRAFYRLADGLLVYGARAREIGKAEGFDPARIYVINNSLDYAAQKRAREAALTMPDATRSDKDVPDKPFFLSVSRLVDSVELDKAIEAMARLPADTALVVVGAGPKREALEKQAKALGVDVRFTGAIYDETRLASLFLQARAVVSPGKVGLLAMHALAYGTPVITHDDLDRQMPEVEAIDAGVTGAFFKRGDVADLARHMGEFLGGNTKEARRAAAIARIEAGYTPEAQVVYITAALDTKIKRVG